jgi:hypothetical protein
LTKRVLCSAGFRTSTIRSVPESEKYAVEVEYGMQAGLYGRRIEIDHIVALELGGSNSIANLFPEPGAGAASYHAKDRLENRLHTMVCAGAIPLLDVAGHRGIDHRPPGTAVGADELAAVAAAEGIAEVDACAVLVRTGGMSRWPDPDGYAAAASAGIDLGAARWLVEELGAVAVGADTPAVERQPSGTQESPHPVMAVCGTCSLLPAGSSARSLTHARQALDEPLRAVPRPQFAATIVGRGRASRESARASAACPSWPARC